MEIVIETRPCLIPSNKITPVTDDTGKAFNLMQSSSPYFATMDALIHWLNTLSSLERANHIVRINGIPYFVFYEHQVAIRDFVIAYTLNDYHAAKGEVLSTDEHSFYNISTSKWNDL